MTNNHKLWRSMLIVLVILSALFGALLLLVGFNQRGHGAAPARGRRIEKNTEERPGRRLCGPINRRLAVDLPLVHRSVDAAAADPELPGHFGRAHALG